jgi:LmbE family N-acetylglucosaminyl deacetylase
MSGRKQQLLKRHRRNKRVALVIGLLLLVGIGIWVAWWLVPLLIVAAWVAHEAWFSDHLFYSPNSDYHYQFPDAAQVQAVSVVNDKLQLSEPLGEGETLLLELDLRSTWLGRWLDPYVLAGDDRQDFERGFAGRRYVNLTGQREVVADGTLRLKGGFCRIAHSARLYVLSNPDYSQQRLMILAPHADDAELAAFGLYSRAAERCIVTVTQGEIEAERYERFGLSRAEAAQLKGRLRTWDSQAIPLWGGVPQSHCVQLGYYCLQLPAMAQAPAEPFGSRDSSESDIRSARQHNLSPLPGDQDGAPTWHNLVADLTVLLDAYRPDVIVMPHPELDPHADHIATTQALYEAVSRAAHTPEVALFYANHLHDNDRWPMGLAGKGVALPPFVEAPSVDPLWSTSLSPKVQLDKAMALAMQHDLQGPLPLKKRLRRQIQRWLAGREWPRTGDDEFFRKAVRRHEVFWVRRFPRP